MENAAIKSNLHETTALRSQPDTGDFTPLSSEPLRGQFKVRIQSEKCTVSYKTDNKVDLLILFGCFNFPAPVQIPPRLCSTEDTMKLKITANYLYVLAFIYITWGGKSLSFVDINGVWTGIIQKSIYYYNNRSSELQLLKVQWVATSYDSSNLFHKTQKMHPCACNFTLLRNP